MTDAEIYEVAKKVTLGNPSARGPLYELLKAIGSGGAVAWADVTGKPTTFAPIIGTTATTAMAGNASPSPTVRGGVLRGAAVADAAAAPTQAEFNALLASLRTAGVIAP